MKMTIQTTCPNCSEQGKEIYRELDRSIYMCDKCGFCYVYPRYGIEEAIEYYEKQYNDFDEKTLVVLSKEEKVRLQYMKKLGAEDPVLEVGSGYGRFLKYLQDNCCKCTGIEINEAQREFSQKNNLKVVSGFEEVSGMKFNTVLFWNVLEHIADYKEMLKISHDALESGGQIFITVPNLKYTLLKLKMIKLLGRKNFDKISQITYGGLGLFNPKEHLNQFSSVTLKSNLEKTGFVNIKYHYSNPFPLRFGFTKKNIVRNLQAIYDSFIARPVFIMSGSRIQINCMIFATGKKP